MTDQIFAREISAGIWQWAAYDTAGELQGEHYHTGDSEALAAVVPAAVPVSIALRGQQVVATQVSIDDKQRKHAAKLIPFELEDDLSSAVDELHFSFAHRESEATSVLYADQHACASAINDIAGQGCDVGTALPDYLLLQRGDAEIVLLLEAGILIVRLSDDWGFSVEQELASLLLTRVADDSALAENPPERIRIVANTEQELELLQSWLPEAWVELEQNAGLGGFWDLVDISLSARSLNMRRGALSRQLPFTKWLTWWKVPAVIFLIAFVCAVVVDVAGFYAAKSKESAIREQINTAYLDAVPGGRLGDVERILESKLSSVKSSNNDPSNISYLLSQVVRVLGESSEITVTSFSFNGDQQALQLTLEFKALSALADMREQLEKLGVTSDSPRTSALGDGYQARLKIQEQR